MEKKIEDYIHYYPGRKLLVIKSRYPYKKGDIISFSQLPPASLLDFIKLILRPLASMTEEEMKECGNMIYDFSNDPGLNKWHWKDFEIGLSPEQFHYLLSKGFDIFGLIESGLAIDSTSLK